MRISCVVLIHSINIVQGSVQSLPDFIPLPPLPKSPDFGLYSSCELPRGSGLMSGICVDSGYLDSSLSFCREFVDSTVCVPPRNPIWPSWGASAKDALIESMVNSMIQVQLDRENDTLSNVANANYTPVFFMGNNYCVENFKRLSCLVNFPSCDATTSYSFPLCASKCVEYFTACRFDPAYTASMCSVAQSIWPYSPDLNSSLQFSGSLAYQNCTGTSGVATHTDISWVTFVVLTPSVFFGSI